MEHYLYENFSDLSASYEYSQGTRMAHPGEDIIWAQPAGRKRRYLGWDVCLQAQDKAFVFCKGDAAYFLYPCGYCMCYLQEFLLEI